MKKKERLTSLFNLSRGQESNLQPPDYVGNYASDVKNDFFSHITQYPSQWITL